MKPKVYAYEFEHEENGMLHGRSRLIGDEPLTVIGKNAENTQIKLRTLEGWIAWASIDDLVKITLN
jgi:hypothetical protein